MIRLTTHKAKIQLSRLISQVLAGEEVLICRGERPAARLVAVNTPPPNVRNRPSVGTITSELVEYSDDAFAPLSDAEIEEWGI